MFKIIALTAAFAASASAASVTFAQTQQSGSTNQWSVTESNGGSTVTVAASGQIYFTFLTAGTPYGTVPQLATFSLSATSTTPGNCGASCGAGDTYSEQGYSGGFTSTDVADGTNLLSGIFSTVAGSEATTGAQFSSSMGGSGGSFNASATAGNLNQLVLSSTYLSFTNQTMENASFALSSLQPNFAVGTVTAGKAYPSGNFVASGTGTFSSDPGPLVTPEPATLGLIGAGLVGLSLLRRRKTSLKA
jgi:hypothetical protein